MNAERTECARFCVRVRPLRSRIVSIVRGAIPNHCNDFIGELPILREIHVIT